jgi:hypothetical protein
MQDSVVRQALKKVDDHTEKQTRGIICLALYHSKVTIVSNNLLFISKSLEERILNVLNTKT